MKTKIAPTMVACSGFLRQLAPSVRDQVTNEPPTFQPASAEFQRGTVLSPESITIFTGPRNEEQAQAVVHAAQHGVEQNRYGS